MMRESSRVPKICKSINSTIIIIITTMRVAETRLSVSRDGDQIPRVFIITCITHIMSKAYNILPIWYLDHLKIIIHRSYI